MGSVFAPEAAKAKKSGKKKGVLNRVLDVVSRPAYASAEFTRQGLKTGSLSKAARGAASGLAGTKKTSYSQVVKDLGIKGKPGAVLGFVGDVALDPTTYLTLGAGAAAKTGAKTAAIKFGGKTVAQSEKVYRSGKAVKRAAHNTPLGQELGKTFNKGHGLPPKIKAIQQKYGGIGSQDFKKNIDELKVKYADTTKAERKLMHKAYTEGNDALLPSHLQGLQKEAREILGKKPPKSNVKTLYGRNEDITDVLARDLRRKNLKASHEAFLKESQKRFGKQIKADPEIAKAMHTISRTFSDDDALSGYFVKHFDKVQSLWKTQATVLNPGHHVRNLIGDTYMNFLDGVRPRAYHDAVKVISDHIPDAHFTIGKFGKLSKNDIKTLYEKQGLKSGFTQSEDIFRGGGKFKTAGKIMEKISKGTDKREDFARYAHFIDALRKEAKRSPDLAKAAERAAARVRKYNFDWTDLTARERKYLKRAVPFYTFTRKALPIQLETLFMKPGKMATISKGQKMTEKLLGVEGQEHGPLPGLDHALPPWYEDQLVASAGDNKIISPSLPIDLLGQYTTGGPAGVTKEALGNLSPLIKAGPELAMGRDLKYGFKQKPSKYLLDQISYGRLGRQQFSDKEKKKEKELIVNINGKKVKIDERQANWLTGLGIHKIGPPPASRGKKKKKSSGPSGSVFQ